MRRWLVLAPMLALGTGCLGFGDKTLAELNGIDEVPTYTVDIQPMFAKYCTTCHNNPPVAGAPSTLLTYEQVIDNLARVRVRGVQLGDMPPGAGMPDEDKAKLEAWISGGAPLGTPVADMDVDMRVDSGPQPDMGDGSPTWDTLKNSILSGCAFEGCHGGGGPSAGLNLTTYAGFLAGGNSGVLHGEGDASASYLIDRLRARNGSTVMPLGGPQWADDEIVQFELWINSGFPEN